MTSREEAAAALLATRAELRQIREEVEALRAPEFLQEFGMSLLQALFAQSSRPAGTPVPESAEPAAPEPPPPPSSPPMPKGPPPKALVTDDYNRTLAFFPIPGLIVESDGTILAANVPAEELFGKPLQGTFLDNLLPERHRGQHAYWRAGFVRKPAIRLMGRGRSVLGLRGDGVEMDLDVGLAPFPDAPGLTFAFMVPRAARG
jgi:hypothetical protein